MKDEELLERIALNPKVMTGKPVVRGTRLTVEFILNRLAHGATTEEVLAEYQGLEVEDIRACFLFATRFLGDTEFYATNRRAGLDAFSCGRMLGAQARCVAE